MKGKAKNIKKVVSRLKPQALDKTLRNRIKAEVINYYQAIHAGKGNVFIKGKTKINYAGRVFDEKEMVNLVNSSLDFWLTAGRFAEELEKKFRKFFNSSECLLVNSGSSANLLMVATLCSRQLENHLKPGDEVITQAACFPTTLAPLLQYNLVPVFVDCEVGTYNINPKEIKKAISPKTKAIFITHTLGNPCNMEQILKIARQYHLFLLEDACDALGAIFDNRIVGGFGDMSSLSFYPAHHMTMGEGGAVVINNPKMVKIAHSIRDWGRDCWCAPGKNNTCGRRFSYKWEKLPFGYDHKYVYSNIGYNLKITDMQAAVGCAQFEKLPNFIRERNANFQRYFSRLKKYESFLILPRKERKAVPSWFGFPITVSGGLNRERLTKYLEDFKIETRLLFAGNILKQPGFSGIAHRNYGNLKNTGRIMKDTFFLGVYPGLTPEKINFILDKIDDFFRTK